MRIVKSFLKKLKFLIPVVDFVLWPINFISVCWFRIIKFLGLRYTPVSRWMFHKLGMFPVVDHYYEPFFQHQRLSSLYDQPRTLSGIDWNVREQLSILAEFNFQNELQYFPIERNKDFRQNQFFHKNGSYSFADAEYLYSFLRLKKPKRIIEVGSGYSTLVMTEAIHRNEVDNAPCKLMCIEPYEMPWLETLGVTVIRKTIEQIELTVFDELESGDILFIDSSHIIKPEGDVLYEIFSVLPVLQRGVYIHFHDIFTPFNYPKQWLSNDYRFWNEQYLLEAFLSNNHEYTIIGAVHYLFYFRAVELLNKLPISSQYDTGGASLWIQKV